MRLVKDAPKGVWQPQSLGDADDAPAEELPPISRQKKKKVLKSSRFPTDPGSAVPAELTTTSPPVDEDELEKPDSEREDQTLAPPQIPPAPSSLDGTTVPPIDEDDMVLEDSNADDEKDDDLRPSGDVVVNEAAPEEPVEDGDATT